MIGSFLFTQYAPAAYRFELLREIENSHLTAGTTLMQFKETMILKQYYYNRLCAAWQQEQMSDIEFFRYFPRALPFCFRQKLAEYPGHIDTVDSAWPYLMRLQNIREEKLLHQRKKNSTTQDRRKNFNGRNRNFNARNQNDFNRNQGNRNNYSSTNTFYKYCKKRGHTIDECRKRQRNGTTSSSSVNFVQPKNDEHSEIKLDNAFPLAIVDELTFPSEGIFNVSNIMAHPNLRTYTLMIQVQKKTLLTWKHYRKAYNTKYYRLTAAS